MPALGDATVFPLPPDGNTNIVVSRSWLTDIVSAGDDTETRVSARDQAVRTMSYTAVFGSAADAGLFRALWYAATEPLRFLVPLWREQAIPTAIAGSTITVDTTLRRFVEGERAILWAMIGDEIVWEVVEIDSLDDDEITTVEDIETEFPIGATYLYPLMAAWLEPPTVTQRGYVEVVPLVFHEELSEIAGIDSTVTGEVTPVVDSATLYNVEGAVPYAPYQRTLLFKAHDEDGVAIVDPATVWAVDVPQDEVILVPSIDKQSARVTILPGATTAFVEATAGGVTATIQVA